MSAPNFTSGQSNFSGFVTVCGGVTPDGVNVPLQVDAQGRLITNIIPVLPQTSSVEKLLTLATNVDIVAAPVDGSSIYVTHLLISNLNAAASTILLSTSIGPWKTIRVMAGVSLVVPFSTPAKLTANRALHGRIAVADAIGCVVDVEYFLA